MKEVVLFDPDFFGLEGDLESENFRFNIGLLSIGSYLKHHGIKTTVFYKSRYYLTDLENIINSKVKLVGISVMTVQFKGAVSLAKKIKKIRPDLQIVVGGCHARLFPKQMLEQKEFDIVVSGGGEVPMLQIFDTLSSGKSLGRIKGLGFRKDGKFIWTKPEEDINIKTLPKMDYSIMSHFSPVKWYDGQKSMYVYSGAGCPFHCTFCVNSINFRKFQQRSISAVIDEIEMLIKTYGITHIYPTDEFFCANKARLLEFLDLIEKKSLHFNWFIQNRADTVTPERLNRQILKRMRKLGCRMMLLGAESGSDKMLTKMNKNLVSSQTTKAVINLVKAGIVPWLTYMIGMPEETGQDYLATMQMMHRLKKISSEIVFSGPSLYRPIPGSLMYNEAMKFYPEGKKISFSLPSDFVKSSLPGSLQAIQCDYPWIQDKKLLYDILVCTERFYTFPGIFVAGINLMKSIILLLCPNSLINNLNFLKSRVSGIDLDNKIGAFKYYSSFYFYFICYFFSWGRSYLLKQRINPESFSPFLWIKWKLLLNKVSEVSV